MSNSFVNCIWRAVLILAVYSFSRSPQSCMFFEVKYACSCSSLVTSLCSSLYLVYKRGILRTFLTYLKVKWAISNSLMSFAMILELTPVSISAIFMSYDLSDLNEVLSLSYSIYNLTIFSSVSCVLYASSLSIRPSWMSFAINFSSSIYWSLSYISLTLINILSSI